MASMGTPRGRGQSYPDMAGQSGRLGSPGTVTRNHTQGGDSHSHWLGGSHNGSPEYHKGVTRGSSGRAWSCHTGAEHTGPSTAAVFGKPACECGLYTSPCSLQKCVRSHRCHSCCRGRCWKAMSAWPGTAFASLEPSRALETQASASHFTGSWMSSPVRPARARRRGQGL